MTPTLHLQGPLCVLGHPVQNSPEERQSATVQADAASPSKGCRSDGRSSQTRNQGLAPLSSEGDSIPTLVGKSQLTEETAKTVSLPSVRERKRANSIPFDWFPSDDVQGKKDEELSQIPEDDVEPASEASVIKTPRRLEKLSTGGAEGKATESGTIKDDGPSQSLSVGVGVSVQSVPLIPQAPPLGQKTDCCVPSPRRIRATPVEVGQASKNGDDGVSPRIRRRSAVPAICVLTPPKVGPPSQKGDGGVTPRGRRRSATTEISALSQLTDGPPSQNGDGGVMPPSRGRSATKESLAPTPPKVGPPSQKGGGGVTPPSRGRSATKESLAPTPPKVGPPSQKGNGGVTPRIRILSATAEMSAPTPPKDLPLAVEGEGGTQTAEMSVATPPTGELPSGENEKISPPNMNGSSTAPMSTAALPNADGCVPNDSSAAPLAPTTPRGRPPDPRSRFVGRQRLGVDKLPVTVKHTDDSEDSDDVDHQVHADTEEEGKASISSTRKARLASRSSSPVIRLCSPSGGASGKGGKRRPSIRCANTDTVGLRTLSPLPSSPSDRRRRSTSSFGGREKPAVSSENVGEAKEGPSTSSELWEQMADKLGNQRLLLADVLDAFVQCRQTGLDMKLAKWFLHRSFVKVYLPEDINAPEFVHLATVLISEEKNGSDEDLGDNRARFEIKKVRAAEDGHATELLGLRRQVAAEGSSLSRSVFVKLVRLLSHLMRLDEIYIVKHFWWSASGRFEMPDQLYKDLLVHGSETLICGNLDERFTMNDFSRFARKVDIIDFGTNHGLPLGELQILFLSTLRKMPELLSERNATTSHNPRRKRPSAMVDASDAATAVAAHAASTSDNGQSAALVGKIQFVILIEELFKVLRKARGIKSELQMCVAMVESARSRDIKQPEEVATCVDAANGAVET
eukprot:TRINITY_DN19214_c0_g5_i1.p1 TRINITY_DN19214_c0_g5~~TRINITY_DN19214_c0_g5_i1.p1  ORF type:complete len:911 (-),score=144.80 TRINITY_DN19214_c0_g5_i1:83-2815(-)